MEPTVEKLGIIVTSDEDGDRLIDVLVKRGLPATKVSSTGGFLQRGNVTILAGIDSREVEELVAIVRRECPARTETVNATALPYPDLSFLPVQPPFEVRTGGAVLFVLPVERFVKT
jgi:uncharacterized protein YaaQ